MGEGESLGVGFLDEGLGLVWGESSRADLRVLASSFDLVGLLRIP